ncbi:beta strand repeat-containing protein [Undibacterium sp. Di27W]|uniref:beta strand repeat-containing protein n=1 Tax=Undibacterium sp. Di27W TaxID=3413036 RepID=UPI003BF405C4
MATASDIQNLYIAYFNRPADVAGLAYWQTTPFSLLQIAQSFSQQTEYANSFSSYTSRQTVNALYGNLFNHAADSAGLAYWVGQIDSGAVSIGAAAIAILGGAIGSDLSAVQAKNTAATAFTASMTNNAQAQAAYNTANGSYSFVKTWLAAVVDTSTSTIATNGLATAINNNYKTTGGDTIALGAGAQTINFYNTVGSDTVVIGGINQTVNQVTLTSGTLTVNTSNANAAGLTINAANASGGANINFTDAGKATLTAAALNGVSTIKLFAGAGELLTLSPASALTIQQAEASATLNVTTPQKIMVNQASTVALTLSGVANYTVAGGTTGSITANGSGGSLKVIDTTNDHTITSSVTTTIDASAANYHADTLAGTGNFTVTGAGEKNIHIFDGGLTGNLNVITSGQSLVGVVEGSGAGAVNVTIGGTGMASISTNASHTTTINAVNGVNAFIFASGQGSFTYNAAATGNTMMSAGGSSNTNINLSATGNGNDDITLNTGGGIRIGTITTGLTTITNFKASGTDKIHWGNTASSLSTINIASSDLASLAGNIQAGAGLLTAGDNKAFIVNVTAGAAAGTYVYEHINQSAAVTGIDMIVKLVGAGTIVAGDLMGL